uniref:cytidine deaminase n=1 Tax=Megaviridae environmental sample TaxID=1737588 RepID=A0A5J6VIZ7_9VIRU|nr:MAG: cytidine and deoxycytidylate deaminase zinc-binding region protein [Megaviridae environmental sample]
MLATAQKARNNAYQKYSGFSVGAAVKANSLIYKGANVENASYGLTICAERVAICNAVSDGHRAFEEIVLVTPNGETPCGACRQVMCEFPDCPLKIYNKDNELVLNTRTHKLLPNTFIM